MKRMTGRITLLGLVLLLAVAGRAQEKPKGTLTPLKLQVVFSEYDGERKVSSIPYTLSLSAPSDGEGDRSKIRVGVRVPLVVVTKDANVQYQNVGTDIDTRGRVVENNLYKIDLSVRRSLVYSPEENKPQGGLGASLSPTPIFREFWAEYDLLMKDGQTIQSTLATDPVSGRVMKVDVTLTVVK